MRTYRPETGLSVVIPTHLPCSLERTLTGLGRQSETNLEVIIVENGIRSDSVSTSIKRWQNKLNLRYFFDALPGLNRARNTGAGLAKNRYVALIDDDCQPSERWAESILVNQHKFADAAAIGGPVTLEFESCPPDWLKGEFRTCLSELDRGGTTRVLDEGEFLYGANMAFSRSVFRKTGGFAENIGMNTRNPPQLANDEIVFLEEATRVSRSGQVYCPEMCVAHYIPTSRMALDRMFQRRYGQGLSDVALMRRRHGPGSDKTLLRYIGSVFPHPWHYQQFRKNLRQLEPKAGGKYLRHHVVCRTGYLLGYRQALSNSADSDVNEFLGSPLLDHKAGKFEHRSHPMNCTCTKGKAMDIDVYMAELMYRRDSSGKATTSLEQADHKLGQLITLARTLEPRLFNHPMFGHNSDKCHDEILKTSAWANR